MAADRSVTPEVEVRGGAARAADAGDDSARDDGTVPPGELRARAEAPWKGWLDDVPDGQPGLADPAPDLGRSRTETVRAAVVFLGVTVAVGVIAGVIATANRGWLDDVESPRMFPAGPALLAPWVVSYALVAVGAFLGWRASGGRLTTTMFTIELLAALAWVVCFYPLESFGGAQLMMAALFCAALLSTMVHWQASLAAGLLLLPRLAWIGYAFVATAGYAALNME